MASLLLLFAATAARAAGAIEAVPAEPGERVSCSRGSSVPFVTWKRAHGTNRNRSVYAYGLVVDRRIDVTGAKIDELENQQPVDETRIARLELRRQRLLALAAAVADCGSGEIFEGAKPPSFRMLCRFGFYAPSVATRHECSMALTREMDEASGLVSPSSWNVDAVAGVLDELLAEACGRSGGVLLRNTNLSAGAPMYSAFCAHEGSPVETHYGDNTLVLGMEEEPTGDCIAAQFITSAADDPCGDYKRPPRGGGTGTPPPPPTSGDCLIQRMEEEPTGCE